MQQLALVNKENYIRNLLSEYHGLKGMFGLIIEAFGAQFTDAAEATGCTLDGGNNIVLFDGTVINVVFDMAVVDGKGTLGRMVFQKEVKEEEFAPVLTMYFDDYGHISSTPQMSTALFGYGNGLMCKIILVSLLEAHLDQRYKITV